MARSARRTLRARGLLTIRKSGQVNVDVDGEEEDAAEGDDCYSWEEGLNNSGWEEKDISHMQPAGPPGWEYYCDISDMESVSRQLLIGLCEAHEMFKNSFGAQLTGEVEGYVHKTEAYCWNFEGMILIHVCAGASRCF